MAEEAPRNVPVFSGGLYNTAQIKIWQEILVTESTMQREWEEKWGPCYKAPNRQPRPGRRQLATSTSTTFLPKSHSVSTLESLASAGVKVMEAPPFHSKVSPDDARGDRARVMEKMNELPARWRYKTPVTSAHAIGWSRSRPTLELFGASQFGIRRNPELMPDI
mmetsp:Transcript_128/g.624  ORF Transcript_128/g.624 Transcript_128/m.624 type:complete len:164 (+) Transcript_128:98-589(+)|eukprot:CAMPEP_0204239380 /NCGR_PEP_ID=MMETSP0361-20130328/94349_1 /ASSEMBLY_ACC=CAM_ASM_000343 /TAXON_ID=268821 /ORGANISM="Scrippsiella Hangoei, Strain SHTV-5" /LENGTH=163 /DNA_ID=CAMNT_0051212173 /DNA_START=65 /DNA_END=556 /DNA_ORIENTATION=-